MMVPVLAFLRYETDGGDADNGIQQCAFPFLSTNYTVYTRTPRVAFLSEAGFSDYAIRSSARTAVLARAWKLTALLSARRIARLYFADLYRLRKSSFSLVVKRMPVRHVAQPHPRIGTVFSPCCGAPFHRIARGTKQREARSTCPVFNVREPHSVVDRR